MAVTRSGVLGRMNSVSGANVYTLFTVPAGMTYIVKDVMIQNQTAGVLKVIVWLQDAGDTVEGVIQELSMAARQVVHWQGWGAAGPGDKMTVFIDVATPGANVWASGAKLPGVA